MPPHLPTETLHIAQVVTPPQQYGDIESIVNVLTAELVHRGHVIRSGQTQSQLSYPLTRKRRR